MFKLCLTSWGKLPCFPPDSNAIRDPVLEWVNFSSKSHFLGSYDILKFNIELHPILNLSSLGRETRD